MCFNAGKTEGSGGIHFLNVNMSVPNVLRLLITMGDFTDELLIRTLPSESGVSTAFDSSANSESDRLPVPIFSAKTES